MAGGMTVAQIDSGALKVTVLPGRGMGLWKASGAGHELCWQSPVRSGPVNPSLVNAHRRGGIGWLDGFDELLCRCGLAFNGPPGKDDDGREITLHGRVANLPAWKLDAVLDYIALKDFAQTQEIPIAPDLEATQNNTAAPPTHTP